jgi:hypothetical protein
VIDPDELRALGVDPEPFQREICCWLGYGLDREKDAALIARVRVMRWFRWRKGRPFLGRTPPCSM